MQGYRDPFNRGVLLGQPRRAAQAGAGAAGPAAPQLRGLPHRCAAVLRAEGGVLHYQRVGATETAEIIVNRSEHTSRSRWLWY